MVLYANLVSSIIQMWLFLSSASGFGLPPKCGSAWGTQSHLLGAAVGVRSILTLHYPAVLLRVFYWGFVRGCLTGWDHCLGRSGGRGWRVGIPSDLFCPSGFTLTITQPFGFPSQWSIVCDSNAKCLFSVFSLSKAHFKIIFWALGSLRPCACRESINESLSPYTYLKSIPKCDRHW